MIQIEIASWLPQHRNKVLRYFANYIDEHGPFRLTMRDSRYKPGVQQSLYDVAKNRCFTLWYEYPRFSNPTGLYQEYKPALPMMNFQIFNVMEIIDVLADEESFNLKRHSRDFQSNKFPRIQIEVATWAPEQRDQGNRFVAELAKEYGPPPVRISAPDYKPGIQQIWCDILSNRFFSLLFYDGNVSPQNLFDNHKPLLDVMNCEIITVLEVDEILEDY